MKAAFFSEYGSADVVQIKEVPRPTIKEDEVLVRIFAFPVTSGDARIRGLNVPFGFKTLVRLMFGLTQPRKHVLGTSFAGEVVEIGSKVSNFQVGDAVYGASEDMGSHAEYIAVSATKAIAHKPANISFEEAAALPFGAKTSLMFLQDLGKIKAGDKVLINGASGSLGVYAVQLAKHFGAEVTAVCSTKNVDWVKDLGADEVVDYTQTDVYQLNKQFNIIYDTVGKLAFSQSQKLLVKGGRFLMAVAGLKQYLQLAGNAIWGSRKMVTGVAMADTASLELIKKLVEDGALKPIIDSQYTMDQIADAHKKVDSGRKKGSVIVVTEPALVG